MLFSVWLNYFLCTEPTYLNVNSHYVRKFEAMQAVGRCLYYVNYVDFIVCSLTWSDECNSTHGYELKFLIIFLCYFIHICSDCNLKFLLSCSVTWMINRKAMGVRWKQRLVGSINRTVEWRWKIDTKWNGEAWESQDEVEFVICFLGTVVEGFWVLRHTVWHSRRGHWSNIVYEIFKSTTVLVYVSQHVKSILYPLKLNSNFQDFSPLLWLSFQNRVKRESKFFEDIVAELSFYDCYIIPNVPKLILDLYNYNYYEISLVKLKLRTFLLLAKCFKYISSAEILTSKKKNTCRGSSSESNVRILNTVPYTASPNGKLIGGIFTPISM